MKKAFSLEQTAYSFECRSDWDSSSLRFTLSALGLKRKAKSLKQKKPSRFLMKAL
jgi:hypothetical protein